MIRPIAKTTCYMVALDFPQICSFLASSLDMVYELHNVMPQKIWLLEGSKMPSLLTHKQQLPSALEYHTVSSSKSTWLGHKIVERSG